MTARPLDWKTLSVSEFSHFRDRPYVPVNAVLCSVNNVEAFARAQKNRPRTLEISPRYCKYITYFYYISSRRSSSLSLSLKLANRNHQLPSTPFERVSGCPDAWSTWSEPVGDGDSRGPRTLRRIHGPSRSENLSCPRHLQKSVSYF